MRPISNDRNSACRLRAELRPTSAGGRCARLCYTSRTSTPSSSSAAFRILAAGSKLREIDKSSSASGQAIDLDLLIAMRRILFYDDLVRESRCDGPTRGRKRRCGEAFAEEEKHRKEELEARKSKAIDMAVETLDALVAERGDSGKFWASVLKEAFMRRKPI